MTPTEMRDAPTEEEMKAAIERLKWFAAACRKPVEADDERFGDYISGDDGGAAADIDLLLSVQPSRPQGGWRPISEAPDDPYAKIIGWCTFMAGSEARFCQRNRDGEWIAFGRPQRVTHFKPWPVQGPSPSTHGEG